MQVEVAAAGFIPPFLPLTDIGLYDDQRRPRRRLRAVETQFTTDEQQRQQAGGKQERADGRPCLPIACARAPLVNTIRKDRP
ncbi:hypothetical protein E6W36_08870 [Hankyongella ginsenosidimutans]|uniref:Uncharacterized protein n=1 Tax=Hankyongella ginsenosidimutans TaxID=1763828 RepID=A0A4D7C1L7_9SPHN|nr:hypothetical protein [Hankyongella ginsenosidimutans]QCI79614.1 hypothetical protein E6W36_08870 [Hankyongella ginsenosidimutans]